MPPKTKMTPEQVAEDVSTRVIDNSTKKSRSELKKGQKNFQKSMEQALVQAVKPDFEK